MCLTTRAIHFETLATVDASELLMTITRFTSQRGVTTSILRSDNGTNMARASKEIADATQSLVSDHSFMSELAV